MRLRISTITRGSGKVYSLMCPYVDDVARWRCVAHTAGGYEVPCKVIELKDARQVLVTPVLDTDVDVQLTTYDGQGATLASGNLRVRAGLSKRSSQLNTLIKNQRAEAIRNCDSTWRVEDAHVELVRIVTSPVGVDRVHFSVTYSNVDNDCAAAPLEPLVLGSKGEPLAVESTFVLGDTSYDHPDAPGVHCRRVLLSAVIPDSTRAFVLWVRCPSGVLPDGFLSIEDFVARDARNQWNERERLFAEYDPSYNGWFRTHRTEGTALDLQRTASHTFTLQPTISLVVPLFHTPTDLFGEMVASVLAQTYPCFELVLVNSTPEDTSLADAVRCHAERDRRIKVIELDRNLGITENTYAGVRACTGDFVAFLDHDDAVEPDLLYWYVKGINEYPDTDMLYCDEDKLEDGRYLFPNFKPDWDPFFLETNNYVCHLLMVRRSLLSEAPTFTHEYDGAQDHALTLWVGAHARNVYHVRKVLYHWRIHDGSTAGDTSAKDNSTQTGTRVLCDHFERCGIAATPEVIDRLPNCHSIRATGQRSDDVTLLVCGSLDQLGRGGALDTFSASVEGVGVTVRGVATEPEHTAAAINAVVRELDSEFVVMVSADAKPASEGWLELLLGYLGRPGVGVVAPLCVRTDGTLVNCGVVCANDVVACSSKEFLAPEDEGAWSLNTLAHQVSAVHGGCLGIRRQLLMDISLDESMPAGLWDVDVCLAARERGEAVVLVPEAKVTLCVDASSLHEDDVQRELAWRGGQARLMRKRAWAFCKADPFYSFYLGIDGRRRLGTDEYVYRLSDTFLPEPLVVNTVIADGDEAVVRVLAACMLGQNDIRDPILQLQVGEERTAVSDLLVMGSSRIPLPAYPGYDLLSRSHSARIPLDALSGMDLELVLVGDGGGTSTSYATLHLDADDLRRVRESWGGFGPLADADVGAYRLWLDRGGRSSERALGLQRAAVTKLSQPPTFSFVVPLFETPLDFFDEMAASVLAQTYPYWELVLVNASPKNKRLSRAVEELCAKDTRVKYVTLEANLGITENTKHGIRAATGEFICFLDHDDIIEPDLLYWYGRAVVAHPTTDLLYCDEDHLRDTEQIEVFFKPDWDLQLLCYENYVCHLLCVRSSLVRACLEQMTSDFDGSQDHHLTLLAGERARNVFHVRRVLYHWRMHAGSTVGAGIEQKSYAIEAERRAVQEHLDRTGVPADAEMYMLGANARCRLTYRFEQEQPLVSIVIPSHDSISYLRNCVESILRRTTWPNYELVIVENGSTQEATFAYYDELASEHANVKVTTCAQPDGFNFSLLINHGVREAKGDYLLLLNNDTEVLTEDWIERLIVPILYQGAGCVGAKLLYADGLVQHVGVTVGRELAPAHNDYCIPDSFLGYYECQAFPHRLSAVTGACLMTVRAAFEAVGGFDEGLPVNYNDVDYCLKVGEAGYAIVEQVEAKLLHFESISRGADRNPEKKKRWCYEQGTFCERWLKYLVVADPYHSPNFGMNSLYQKLVL